MAKASRRKSKAKPVAVDRRTLHVHLVPSLVSRETLRDSFVVVIDVLRATTTIVHALAAGCTAILPKPTIEEARAAAESIPAAERLLAGERDGIMVPGFDLGNSPGDFTSAICLGRTCIFTTSNGTRAIDHARLAKRMIAGAFVNFSAVCDELRASDLPVHLLCAGAGGHPALEDTIFAGAVVDFMADEQQLDLNDSARIAWDAYENHGQMLISSIELSSGGQMMLGLGFDDDVKAAADVDRYGLVPEISGEPPTIHALSIHCGPRRFRGHSGLIDDA